MQLFIDCNIISGSVFISANDEKEVDIGVPTAPGESVGEPAKGGKGDTAEIQGTQSDKGSSKVTPKKNHNLFWVVDDMIVNIEEKLGSLEETFSVFIRKTHDFVLNLVEMLSFEKKKQKLLQKEYEQLKQENDNLKTQNEYLKSVKENQIHVFKQELDNVTYASNASCARVVSETCRIEKQKVRILHSNFVYILESLYINHYLLNSFLSNGYS